MFPRNLAENVRKSLRDTPVVYLQGARQTGKSTLALEIATNEHPPRRYLTLDHATALAAASADAARLREDRHLAGRVFEKFVGMELVKQIEWASVSCRLFHFRAESGRVTGIEVKWAATVDPSDFLGMDALAEAAGERFTRGIVLYLGGDRFAVSVADIWA